jgi:hypothetical protein
LLFEKSKKQTVLAAELRVDNSLRKSGFLSNPVQGGSMIAEAAELHVRGSQHSVTIAARALGPPESFNTHGMLIP